VIKAIGTTAAALLVAGGLFPGTATAAETAICGVGLGSVTLGGDHREQAITSTVPPTAGSNELVGAGVYPPSQVRISTSMVGVADEFVGMIVDGFVVIEDGLYRTSYDLADGTVDPDATGPRIGSGWANFVALEQSQYQGPTDSNMTRWNTYGLRSDGTLFRWTLDANGVWRSKVSAPGFAAVKSMVLISKSKTYDTFLANTRGGALYTIHIPTSSPMKPIVKLVRSRTWQGFETMVAQKCGQYGTVVLGIDKDANTGYLYAVGHATGATTVIQSLGKVPATFSEDVYFRWMDPSQPLNGE
jgi:hypothetical protein